MIKTDDIILYSLFALVILDAILFIFAMIKEKARMNVITEDYD